MPGPDYMYDVGMKPEVNRMVTSSWAHPHSIIKGPAPMDQVGDEAVGWDFTTGKVLQETHLDKAPLEVRWLHGPAARGGIINSAFGNRLRHWEAKVGKPSFPRLPQPADWPIPPGSRR